MRVGGTGTDRNYIVDGSQYGSVEQTFWRWMLPVVVLGRELCLGEMTKNSCHGHLTSAPWLAKVKLKAVVLDVFVLRCVLRNIVSAAIRIESYTSVCLPS